MADFNININEIQSNIVGETVAAGDLVYLSGSGKYYRTNASTTLTSSTELKLCMSAGAANTDVDMLVYGYYTFTNGLVLITGQKYYVSSDLGEITTQVYSSSFNYVNRYVGTASGPTQLLFNPDQTYLHEGGKKINEIPLNFAHKHVEADITDLDKYTKAQVDALITGSNPDTFDQGRYEGTVFTDHDLEELLLPALDDATLGGIHAFRYVGYGFDKIFAISRNTTGPTKFLRFNNTDDLTDYDTVDYVDATHFGAEQMVLYTVNSKMYVALTDPSYTLTNLKVVEWDLAANTVVEVINYDTTRLIGYPTLEIIGNSLYVSEGYYGGYINKFDLTTKAFVLSINPVTTLSAPHALNTDGVSLFGTTIWDGGSGCYAFRIKNDIVEETFSYDFEATLSAGFTDDFVIIGDYIYAGTENRTENGIYKINKNALSDFVKLDVIKDTVNANIYGLEVVNDKLIYVGENTIGSFNINTRESVLFENPFTYSPNEIVIYQDRMFFAGFDVYPAIGTTFVGRKASPLKAIRGSVLATDGSVTITNEYDNGFTTFRDFIGLRDNTKLQGVLGTVLEDDLYIGSSEGLFITHTQDNTFDENDGGMLMSPGKVELRGQLAVIDSLKATTTRQVYVNSEGALFGIEGVAPDWTISDTDTGIYAFTAGWVNIPTLAVAAQATVDPNTLVNFVANIYIDNPGLKGGFVDVGYSLNGAVPVLFKTIRVEAGFSNIVPIAFSLVSHPGFAVTDVFSVSIGGLNADPAGAGSFTPSADGSLTFPHELTVSVPGVGAGGGDVYLAGDNVMTGANTFNQPVVGTDATLSTHLVTKSQLDAHGFTGTVGDNQVALGTATPGVLDGSAGLTYDGSEAAISGNLKVTYTGGDLSSSRPLFIDTSGSLQDIQPALMLNLRNTGQRKGFLIANNGDANGWAMFGYQIDGSTDTPGFILGDGTVARDAGLYRSGVGTLDIFGTQLNTPRLTASNGAYISRDQTVNANLLEVKTSTGINGITISNTGTNSIPVIKAAYAGGSMTFNNGIVIDRALLAGTTDVFTLQDSALTKHFIINNSGDVISLGAGSFVGTVSGANAVNSDDFITKGQLDAVDYSGFVTLNTEQTITAKKTFNAGVKIDNNPLEITEPGITTPFSDIPFDPDMTGRISTYNQTNGGVALQGLSATAGQLAFALQGHVGSTAPTAPAVSIEGWKSNGVSNRTAMTGANKILQVAAGQQFTDNPFTVLANGSIGINDSSASTALSVKDTTNGGNLTYDGIDLKVVLPGPGVTTSNNGIVLERTGTGGLGYFSVSNSTGDSPSGNFVAQFKAQSNYDVSSMIFNGLASPTAGLDKEVLRFQASSPTNTYIADATKSLFQFRNYTTILGNIRANGDLDWDGPILIGLGSTDTNVADNYLKIFSPDGFTGDARQVALAPDGVIFNIATPTTGFVQNFGELTVNNGPIEFAFGVNGNENDQFKFAYFGEAYNTANIKMTKDGYLSIGRSVFGVPLDKTYRLDVNGPGFFSGTVKGDNPVASNDFVTLDYFDNNSSSGNLLNIFINTAVNYSTASLPNDTDKTIVYSTGATVLTLDATGLTIGHRIQLLNNSGSAVTISSPNAIVGVVPTLPNGYFAYATLIAANTWAVALAQAGGAGGSGGDVFLANTQTFTGVNTFSANSLLTTSTHSGVAKFNATAAFGPDLSTIDETYAVHIKSSAAQLLKIERTATTNAVMSFANTVKTWYFGASNGTGDYVIGEALDLSTQRAFSIDTTTKNVGIGLSSSDNADEKLAVKGSVQLIPGSSTTLGATYFTATSDTGYTGVETIMKLSAGGLVYDMISPAGGWARSIGTWNIDGVTKAQFGMYGSGGQAKYVYIGTSFNSNNFKVLDTGEVGIGYAGTDEPTTGGAPLQVSGTAVFTDQVTIPVTPVADTDASSKKYVDDMSDPAGIGVWGGAWNWVYAASAYGAQPSVSTWVDVASFQGGDTTSAVAIKKLRIYLGAAAGADPEGEWVIRTDGTEVQIRTVDLIHNSVTTGTGLLELRVVEDTGASVPSARQWYVQARFDGLASLPLGVKLYNYGQNAVYTGDAVYLGTTPVAITPVVRSIDLQDPLNSYYYPGVGYLGTGGGGGGNFTGSIAANQVGYGTGVDAFGGTNNFTWDGDTLTTKTAGTAAGLVVENTATGNYALQRFNPAGYTNDMYFIGYGSAHAKAGEFHVKNINAGGKIIFSTAGDVVRLTADSNGITHHDTTFLKTGGATLGSKEQFEESLAVGVATTVVGSTGSTRDAVFWNYVVKNGVNVRAGSIMVAHDGTNVEYVESSTADLGDTSDVIFSVAINAGNIELTATTASAGWDIKVKETSI